MDDTKFRRLRKEFDLLTWKKPNFGDALSEWIVTKQFPDICIRKKICTSENTGKDRLLAIGSIFHLANEGDVVWGSGLGNHLKPNNAGYTVKNNFRVLAVRGPLTRATFLSLGGDECPEVYGDPALLLPRIYVPRPTARLIKILPHVHDRELARRFCHLPCISAATYNFHEVIDAICSSTLLITSSLHALIIADAYGIPVVLYFSESIRKTEPDFKYRDYFASTGRAFHALYSGSLDAVVNYSGKVPSPKFPDLDLLVRSMSEFLLEV